MLQACPFDVLFVPHLVCCIDFLVKCVSLDVIAVLLFNSEFDFCDPIVFDVQCSVVVKKTKIQI